MNSIELQSKVFDFLRFPLIIGVIFIHNVSVGKYVDTHSYFVYNLCCKLFSEALGRIAVPIFFIMSGYLFFYNLTKFDRQIYKQKIKSRFKTLFVPYMFWNTIFLIVYYFVTSVPILSKLFNEAPEYNWNFIILSYIGKLDDTGMMTYPIVYQFWFIRDLIVLVVFTPLIYLFLKYIKVYGIVVVGCCWLFGLSFPYLGIRGFSTISWFFFLLGAYLSVNKLNIALIVQSVGNWIYFLYVLVLISFLIDLRIPFLHETCIFIGIICCFKFVVYLIEKRNYGPNEFLSSASFFIFAIHEPWLLNTTRKIVYNLFQPTSEESLVILYFAEIVFVVLIALSLYSLLRSFSPRLLSIITGGR